MEGKRGIRIVIFLYYIQEKGWEGGGNLEEVTVTMFDGVKPEAQIPVVLLHIRIKYFSDQVPPKVVY
jgi:hypothetical protein